MTNTQAIQSIELDFMVDEAVAGSTSVADVATDASAYGERFGAAVQMVELNGPSGHAVVRFTGSAEALAALEADYDG